MLPSLAYGARLLWSQRYVGVISTTRFSSAGVHLGNMTISKHEALVFLASAFASRRPQKL